MNDPADSLCSWVSDAANECVACVQDLLHGPQHVQHPGEASPLLSPALGAYTYSTGTQRLSMDRGGPGDATTKDPGSKSSFRKTLQARHTVSFIPPEDEVQTPVDFRSKYELGGLVGVGTSSKCYVTTRRVDGKEFACKVIDLRKLAMTHPAGVVDQFRSEISTLEILNHPNIIRLEDHFDTDDRIFIVMELLRGGELFDRIVSENGLREEDARTIFTSVCDAIRYMHEKNVIHRDVKPENMLLVSNKSSDVKIIDFGFSKVVTGGAFARSFMGTGGFLAPELRYSNAYTKSVDMWSLGVTLYVMLSGFLPFDVGVHPKPESQYVLRFPSKQWSHVSSAAKDLITRLLVVDPRKRCTAVGVMLHPWITGASMTVTPKQTPQGAAPTSTNHKPPVSPFVPAKETNSSTRAANGLNDHPEGSLRRGNLWNAIAHGDGLAGLSTDESVPNNVEMADCASTKSSSSSEGAVLNTPYLGPTTKRQNGLLLSRDRAKLVRSESLPVLSVHENADDTGAPSNVEVSRSVHGGMLFKSWRNHGGGSPAVAQEPVTWSWEKAPANYVVPQLEL